MRDGEKKYLRWLGAGACAGLAVDLTLYPIDTIKTRIQSQAGFQKSGGFKNIYGGVRAVALGSAPGSALFFFTYSSLKDFLNHQGPFQLAFCASVGETAACLIRVPTEIVKQRGQTTKAPIGHLVKELYFAHGFFGFYKGLSSTLFREIPFSFIEFPLWEILKRRASGHDECCSPLKSAACGSLAGSISAAITTPFDAVKTRIMLNREMKTRLVDAFREIMREKGIRGLYAGSIFRSIWMGLGGFVFFFSYEFSLKTINRII